MTRYFGKKIFFFLKGDTFLIARKLNEKYRNFEQSNFNFSLE